jgi:hypothetical protein
MSHASLTDEDLRDIQAGPVYALYRLSHRPVSFFVYHRVIIPTRSKIFFFFRIENSADFRVKFKNDILQNITSSFQARECRHYVLQAKAMNNHCEVLGTNIGFSSKGLAVLGIQEDIGDVPFAEGQLNRAENELADDLSLYREEFRTDSGIHGIFIVTGCCSDAVGNETDRIEQALGDSIVPVFKRECNERPGKELKNLNHCALL